MGLICRAVVGVGGNLWAGEVGSAVDNGTVVVALPRSPPMPITTDA